ncbi:MAG: permease [Pirellulales bacterium]
MNTLSLRFPVSRIRCYYRPLILVATATTILCVFWFASRYPQLLAKRAHIGQELPSMAWSSEVFHIAPDTPLWRKILFGAVNWLDSMKIGMTFGVLTGAMLHTFLRYYPLKIGTNLYLNSLKGALVGAPAGVCANCAVPMACGVTRGHGRVEVALGFLFSSPNFNPVVVAMTFSALPLTMSLTKYAILLLVILGVIPVLIYWLERSKPLKPFTVGDDGGACAVQLKTADCTEPFWSVFGELARDYGMNIWMLVKPTITLMLLASVISSVLLVLIPWQSLLSEVTPLRLAFVSMISVFMPVPIALDVMFASQLQQQGVAGGYVMLFAMTLGTYSIIPSIYLWREVSKRLSVLLFIFFIAVGLVTGLLF